MRDFSKNPNKIDDSDEDSDIDISVDIDEVRTLLNPYNESDTSDNAASGNEIEDSEDDDDYVPETNSDESIIETVPQTTAAGMNSRPSTSGTAITSDNVSDDEFEEEDNTIKAIRAAIKKPRNSPPKLTTDDYIVDLSFHPTDDLIALGTIIGDVLIYKYSNEENTLLKKLEVHTKACRTVEFDDDGKCLLTGSKDKSIMITDVETEKLKQFYDNAHDSAIYKLYVIDENMFATGDESGTVKLWDKRNEGCIFALKEVEDYISAMLTNEAKKLLLVTSGDGYLTTLNIGSRKLFVQSEPYEEELTCMGLYRGDSKLLIGTSKGRLYSYKWGEFGYHSDMYPGVKSPIDCMLPITDRISCLAGDDGIIRATHVAPFKNLGIVGQGSLPVESMDINNSGEFIASSSDSSIAFWNIKYFEDFTDIKYNVKNNDHRDRQHNLPSSKFSNNSDFFADLAD